MYRHDRGGQIWFVCFPPVRNGIRLFFPTSGSHLQHLPNFSHTLSPSRVDFNPKVFLIFGIFYDRLLSSSYRIQHVVAYYPLG